MRRTTLIATAAILITGCRTPDHTDRHGPFGWSNVVTRTARSTFVIPSSFDPGCWTPEAVTAEFLAGKLRRCFAHWMYGPGIDADGCSGDCFDLTDDNDIDLADYAAFLNWLSEPDPAERVTWEQRT